MLKRQFAGFQKYLEIFFGGAAGEKVDQIDKPGIDFFSLGRTRTPRITIRLWSSLRQCLCLLTAELSTTNCCCGARFLSLSFLVIGGRSV